MISNRHVLKEIVKFGKREYKEKKPSNVKILRIKDETIFTKGEPFKRVRIAKISHPHYLVQVEYDKNLRINFFSKSGMLLGGENFEKTSELINIIIKNTVKEYSIPQILSILARRCQNSNLKDNLPYQIRPRSE